MRNLNKRTFHRCFLPSFGSNENLKGQLDATKNVLGNVKTTLNRNVILTKDATIQSNYNEQYSRKNNIKVFNMKKKRKTKPERGFH
jgi:hypothetical protein